MFFASPSFHPSSTNMANEIHLYHQKPQNLFPRVRAYFQKCRVSFPIHYRNNFQYFSLRGRLGGFPIPMIVLLKIQTAGEYTRTFRTKTRKTASDRGKLVDDRLLRHPNLRPRKQLSLNVTKHQKKRVRAFENTS